MNKNIALLNYTLRLGDDSVILGHRLSELCSKAPFIEEDLALTNISLDMIGRASAFYKYAAELEGKGRTEDDLAYKRPEKDFRNHLITEQPNGDFAHTIARQLYISVFEYLYFSALEKSDDSMLSAIAMKVSKEVKYHMQHAASWTIRLGDGTKESQQRMQTALNDLWMYTGELFETDDADKLLIKEAIAVDPVKIQDEWLSEITNILSEATLQVPQATYMQTGGKKGIHTENLGHILAEMQYLQRAYPDATW